MKLGAGIKEGDEMRVIVDSEGKIFLEKRDKNGFNDYSDNELDFLEDDIWTEKIIRANKHLIKEI